MTSLAQRKANVRFKDQPAGVLEEHTDGSTVFTYAEGWDRSIGCALPADVRVHSYGPGLHPFFQHLTAEGWLRGKQARVSALDEADDLGLLLAYGQDCIGAVSVHRQGDGRTPHALLETLDRETRDAVSGERTISGVQKKLLIVRQGHGYTAAGRYGAAPFIAKFNSSDLPTIVRNEALTLSFVRTLIGEAEVAKSERALIDGYGDALLVTRFDRKEDGTKLAMEDLCQVLLRPRGRNNEYKYDSSHEEAGEAIRRYSALPVIDVLKFFRRTVVNALLGNCDAHLKNFSLLETPAGPRLSPVYDAVNTVLYRRQGYSTQFALRIDGAKQHLDQVDRALLQRLADNLAINRRSIDTAFRELRNPAARVLASLRRLADAEQEGTFASDYHDVVLSGYERIFGDG